MEGDFGKGSVSESFEKHFEKVLLFSAFLFILAFILFTSFFNGIPLTGNALNGGKILNNADRNTGTTTSGIDFDAYLTVPSLNLDGKFGSLEISGSSDTILTIGSDEYNLGDLSINFISFGDFDGKVSFDKSNIKTLNGKASKISINGVDVSTSKPVKVNLQDSFSYSSLEISDTVSITSLNYKTSGVVELNNGKQSFDVNNDAVKISGFQGRISVEKNKFSMTGKVSDLSIEGESSISIK